MDTLDKRLQKRIYASLYALLFLTGLLGLSVLLEGCADTCDVTREYSYYRPIYTSLDEFRSGVSISAPQQVTAVGKIYFKDGWLFINEPGKGIHIIDNHTPASPTIKSFLNIPGNYDLAVKGNTLYADSYIDLVVFDITDMDAVSEINRLKNVFSNYNTLGFYVDTEKGIVTGWEEDKEVKVFRSDCSADIQPWGGMYYEDGIALQSDMKFDVSAAITPGIGSGPGVGGSMARFAINHDHLYTLDGGDVQTIDITSEASPLVVGKTNVSWDMETIFPHGNNLFIGSRSGMHIMDISEPASPVKISTYQHVRVCDPVTVQDNLAYVTLRSGTECEGFTNQLEVINIADLQNPQLLKTYPMTNPHGLGIDQNTLFVCDGSDGLKVYDASDIDTIDKNQLAHYKNINAFDVIPFNNILMMIGEDGIFQYDYTNPQAITFLSKILIHHEN
jgi:hypothetical protein